MTMDREQIEAEQAMRSMLCGALNPGTAALAPCSLLKGHAPVSSGVDAIWAHRNERGQFWGDVLPPVWSEGGGAERCRARTEDYANAVHRCAYVSGHGAVWMDGNRYDHGVPRLVSWNEEGPTIEQVEQAAAELCGVIWQPPGSQAPTYTCTEPQGHGPIEKEPGIFFAHRNVASGVTWGQVGPGADEARRIGQGLTADEAIESLAEQLVKGGIKARLGVRTFEVPCSKPDCERCADLRPAPAAKGLRIRLMPLPFADLGAYAFALVVDGYADDETAAKCREHWAAEGQKISAAWVLVLPGRVELWDVQGEQYGA